MKYSVNQITSNIFDVTDGGVAVATTATSEMAEKICAALNFQAEIEAGNIIAKPWHIDDVRTIYKADTGIDSLSDDDCKAILKTCIKYHNAEVGICNDSILSVATEYLRSSQ